MSRWNGSYWKLLAVAALVLVTLALAACGQNSDSVKAGPTALGSLDAARSALSTTAPDAKLLVVQTAQATATTGTPVWSYLFGSPSTDKLYVVYLTGGKSMGAQEYGKVGLTKEQWAKVPTTDDLKVDSDEALKAALAASGAKGDPLAYMMGILTYKPETDTSTIEPLVWTVQFDPGESGATTSSINVDAKTGKATVSK